MHVRVIDVALFGSRGTFANSLLSGSATLSSPRFARFRADSNLEACLYISKELCVGRTIPKEHVQKSGPFVAMTPTGAAEGHPYHRATFNKTLFESKRVQARLLDFQTKARGRRTSQGIVDTTTVHHQSSRNLSCFWNFVQTQSYADSFVIAVCLLLLEFLL